MNRYFVFTLHFLFLIFISCKQQAREKNWQLTGFVKVDELNPILQPSSEQEFFCPLTKKNLKWEERNVLNPTALVRNDTVFLLYRAQDSLGTSRIGMAFSLDGLNFTRYPEPILYPEDDQMKKYEWHGAKDSSELDLPDCYFCLFDGVEDPRIVMSGDGRYFMTYTSYNGKTARLSIASSPDLRKWTKHGRVLNDPKYADSWSKAGAIIARREGSNTIATKIDGKYWMYFGDTNLFMAYSDDLETWTVAENEENGQRISVLSPRPGMFDSRLVEPGPYGLLTEDGVLLIYNASNAANFNDPGLPKFTYAAGQALFDSEEPYKLMKRSEDYFIYPDKPYEKVGEVNEVCFVEGLVYFNEKWFLYYGTADSKIAVATLD